MSAPILRRVGLMPDKKRILIHANSPWSPTGYGNTTRIIIPLLHEAGWEVIVSCFYGLQGGPLHTREALFLPVGLDPWGNDVLRKHYETKRPDVMLHFHDIWVLAPDVLRTYPVSSWCPIDHTPIPPLVKRGLDACRWPIAMARFGERIMREAGFDPLYIPLSVDTRVYHPGDRDKAREMWGVEKDTFFAIAVAANKGNPSRKSLDRILKAWARFTNVEHPDLDAVLYIHTLIQDDHGGWPLLDVAEHYGIRPQTLRIPDTYRYIMGDYDWPALANLYNAADVKISPSMAEGFGITDVESQACGCPVIVTDYSAQSELCFGGYKIPVDPFDDLVWTYQNSEQANVTPGKIVTGLEWALEHRGDETLRQQAADGARAYDARHVFEKYMTPALNLMAEVNAAERSRWLPGEPSVHSEAVAELPQNEPQTQEVA